MKPISGCLISRSAYRAGINAVVLDARWMLDAIILIFKSVRWEHDPYMYAIW